MNDDSQFDRQEETPLANDACDWAGDVLDEALDAVPPTDPAARRDAADLLFLDALLAHCHDPRTNERELRIERVMAAIRNEPSVTPAAPVPPRRKVARRLAYVLVTAAAISGVALFFISSGPGTQSAHAAVDHIYRATAQKTDRQYVVVGRFQNLMTGTERQVQSELYVRGADCFALKHPSLLGPVWIGSDGRRGWMLTPYNFVMHRDDPRLTIMWAREEGVTMPELQLTSQLDAARAYFDLTLLPSEQIDPHESPIAETTGPTLADPYIRWQRIRCGIRQARDDQPYVLELWAHPQTGVLRRMVFHWRPYSSWRGLTMVSVDLVSEQPLSDAWYTPKGHMRLTP